MSFNPTEAQESMSNTNVSSSQKAKLEQFIGSKKFVAEKLYPGAVNETDRVKFEAEVNNLATRLLNRVDAHPTKEVFFAEFKPTIGVFEFVDSEDRERFFSYLEELMSIFNIKNSGREFNKLIYGFDPQQSLDKNNAEAIAKMSPAERQLLSKLDGITKESATVDLDRILGPASSKMPLMEIWFLDKDANSAISINSQNGATILMWIHKDQFMYTRKL